MLGLRELVIVGLVALALYGRTGLRHTHHARTVWSWAVPRRNVRRTAAAAAQPPSPSFWALSQWSRGERMFWALALVAAAAVSAWIVTRTWIVSAPASVR
jgi:hypothetical protein